VRWTGACVGGKAQGRGIAEWTVVNHLRVVMQKMGCASRVQIVRAMQRT